MPVFRDITFFFLERSDQSSLLSCENEIGLVFRALPMCQLARYRELDMKKILNDIEGTTSDG